MKKLLLLSILFLSLISCGTAKKHGFIAFNHVTGVVKLNDTLQHPNDIDVWNQMDDEFEIVLFGKKVESLKPLNFNAEYMVDIRKDRAYFYSPFMSEYMEKNEWFFFEVEYRKVLK